MTMVEAGTSPGRTFHLALISSAANLANLTRLREISQRLAHPDRLSEADARALAREGRAFVHIDGGLHATEVAGPQHTRSWPTTSSTGPTNPLETVLDNVVLMLAAHDQPRRPDHGRRVVPAPTSARHPRVAPLQRSTRSTSATTTAMATCST
ncbi:MAG: hypothetical protein R2708_28080 [Vicinamibacterales bacterium]